MFRGFLLFLVFFHSSGYDYRSETGELLTIPLVRKDVPLCARPLLSTGEVPAQSIYLSSQIGWFGKYLTKRGRFWCAGEKDTFQPWIQVDLGKVMMVTGVSLEGTQNQGFVTLYTVEYSPDGRVWSAINNEHGKPTHFTPYRDPQGLRSDDKNQLRATYQPFDPFIHTRVLRFRLRGWYNGEKGVEMQPCLQLEIFACDSDWARRSIQLITEQKSVRKSDCHYYYKLGSVQFTRDWKVNGKIVVVKSPPKRVVRLRIDMGKMYFVTNVASSERSPVIHAEHSLDGKRWQKFKPLRKPRKAEPPFGFEPAAARYILARYESKVNEKFDVLVFGCSAEVQSLGLWTSGGRVSMSGVKVNKGNKNLLRLTPEIQAWCFNTAVKDTWIVLDLGRLYVVSHVLTRGDCKSASIVDHLQFMHSLDRRTWIYVPDSTGKQLAHVTRRCVACKRPGSSPVADLFCRVFGHCEAFNCPSPCKCSDITQNTLSPTLYARYLKITKAYDLECLKFDIQGNEPGKPRPLRTHRRPGCDKPLGMESLRIKDSQISSSSAKSHDKAANARLHGPGAWCVEQMATGNLYKRVEYLTIDLKSEKIIDGIATQGNHRARGSERQWVTGYVVHYSIDKNSWDVISTREREKFFIGNGNTNGVVRHRLNPRIRARYVRIVPLTWSKWICMRVEIFGCDAGGSIQEEIDKELQDIERERVDIVPLIYKNTRKVFNCDTASPWGKRNYLRLIADKDHSLWTRHVFNKEVPLFTPKLSVSLTSVPWNVRRPRRFTCAVRTRDGQTLFRQHLVLVDGLVDLVTVFGRIRDHTALMQFFPSDITRKFLTAKMRPLVLAFQPVNQEYIGGRVVWGKPATVWVKGSIATIGVHVYGLVGQIVGLAQCLKEGNTDVWSYTHLGDLARPSAQTCGAMAQLKGLDYSLLRAGKECYSSWYLPAITRPRTKGCRTSVFRWTPLFQAYTIEFFKRENNGNWRRLGQKYIKRSPALRSTSYLRAAMATDTARAQSEGLPLNSRTRVYSDVTAPGDFVLGTHVLEIYDVDASDMGTYKFRVVTDVSAGEALIELRHREEPRLSLPKAFHVCEKVPKQLELKPKSSSELYPSPWDVNWLGVKSTKGISYGSRFRPPSESIRFPSAFKVLYKKPQVDQLQYFEASVSNQFGYARAWSQVFVANASDVPSIVWITKSPFVAIEGMQDTLEVRLASDSNVQKIEWHHDGKAVDDTSHDFSFPGEFSGVRPLRKAVRFTRVTPRTAGRFRVIVKGTHCSFQEAVEVTVIIRPAVILEPLNKHIAAYFGKGDIVMNATIKGGIPKPKRDDILWKKGNSTLIRTQRGRVTIAISPSDRGSWRSVLTIRKPRYSDSGPYRLVVHTGPINVTVQREVRVFKGQDENIRIPMGTAPPRKPTSSLGNSLSCSIFFVSNLLLVVIGFL